MRGVAGTTARARRSAILGAFVLAAFGACGGDGGSKGEDGDASGGDGDGTAPGTASNDPYTLEGCTPPLPKLAAVYEGTAGHGVTVLPDGTIVTVGERIVHPNAGSTSILLVGAAPTGVKQWEELYDEARVRGALERPVVCPNGGFQTGLDVFPWEGGGILVAGSLSLCNTSSGVFGWLVALDDERTPEAELVLPSPFVEVALHGDGLLAASQKADRTSLDLTWIDDDLEVDSEMSVPWPGQPGLGGLASVAALAGGRIALGGTFLRPGRSDQDLWVGFVEEGKGLVAEQWYGSSCDDSLGDLAPHPDGGIVIAGHVPGRVPGHGGPWLAHFDVNGQFGEDAWEWSLAEEGTVHAMDVLPSGQILVAGGAVPETNLRTSQSDFWLLLADDQGGRLWSGTYPFYVTTWAEDVAFHPQGGYVLAGKGSNDSSAGGVGLTIVQTASSCVGEGVTADHFGCGFFADDAWKVLAAGAPRLRFQWKQCASVNPSAAYFDFPSGAAAEVAGEYCVGEDPIPSVLPAGYAAASPFVWVRPVRDFGSPGLVFFSAATLGADPNQVTAVLRDSYDGNGFQPLPGFKASPGSGIVEAETTGTGVFVLVRPAE